MKFRTAGLLCVVALLASGLGACQGGGSVSADSTPSVYTSTDVWASVAKAIAGDDARITASIVKPSQDPHSYEPSVRDKKLVSDADVALINGGGYDDWAVELTESAGVRHLITAVDSAPHDCGSKTKTAPRDAAADKKRSVTGGEGGAGQRHCDVNEHVFYDLDTVLKVAGRLARTLTQINSAGAETYSKNLANFTAAIQNLEHKAQTIADRGAWKSLATEPLAQYLLDKIGVQDLTPAQYIAQCETQAGPSLKVQAQTKALLEQGKVDILIVNQQTEDPLSASLSDIAKAKGIPRVALSETLAGAKDYVTWIDDALNRLDTAMK